MLSGSFILLLSVRRENIRHPGDVDDVVAGCESWCEVVFIECRSGHHRGAIGRNRGIEAHVPQPDV